MTNFSRLVLAAFTVSLQFGCAAKINMLTRPDENLGKYTALNITSVSVDVIGEYSPVIINEIMAKSVKNIVKSKRFAEVFVSNEIKISDKKITQFILILPDSVDSTLSIANLNVTITEYDKGNAMLRFLFGIFEGSGKVTVRVDAVDFHTEKELASATISVTIIGMFGSEGNVVSPIQKAISKFVNQNFSEGGPPKRKTDRHRRRRD